MGSGAVKSFRRRLGIFTLTLSTLILACAGTPAIPKKNMDLIQASRKGDRAKVLSLIREGADINAQDSEGWTPYLAASAEGKWEIMSLLQGMGCKTDPGF
jgi:ankyrin repeat protein